MGVPGVSRLGGNVGESSARRRIRDANQMLTGRALDLPTGEMRLALQGLVTMGTVEFEFGRCHVIGSTGSGATNGERADRPVSAYILMIKCALWYRFAG